MSENTELLVGLLTQDVGVAPRLTEAEARELITAVQNEHPHLAALQADIASQGFETVCADCGDPIWIPEGTSLTATGEYVCARKALCSPKGEGK